MKIIIVTQGSLGDVRPFLSIGIAFRKRGDEVIVCAPGNFQELFSSHGFQFYSIGLDFQSIASENGADKTEKVQKKKSVMQLLNQSITDQFLALPSIAKEAGLIIGNGFDFAGRSIAGYYKIPYFIIVPMPLAFRSKYHAPMSIPYQHLPSWLNLFFWWAGEIGSKILFCKKINKHRRDLGLSEISNYTDFMSEDALLAADSILAPLPPDCKNIFQCGFLDFDEEIMTDRKILDFINEGTPPVYIGFGSMTYDTPEKTSEILKELIECGNFRFIISKGWANLGLKTESKNVLFIDYVPHSKLFPMMSVIIHHGGAGTTSAAARAGIPQIIIPHAMDQFYWGDRVMKLKIGVAPIPRKKLTGKKLADAVCEINDKKEYRENAEKIGLIASQQNGVEEAVYYIEARVS